MLFDARKRASRRMDVAEWKRALPSVTRGFGGVTPIGTEIIDHDYEKCPSAYTF